MNAQKISLFVVLFCVLLLPGSALAHKMTVFAWASGNQIQGEIKFSGGRRAKHVPVEAEDAKSHAVLLKGETNDNGEFTLTLSADILEKKPDLLIVASGGDGHRGEWPLNASEYVAAETPSMPAADTTTAPVSQEETAATESPSISSDSTVQATTVDEQMLRRIVSEEVNRAVTPIRRTLAEESEHEPSLQDILGGIGWIIGMAGLAAWLLSRKRKSS